MNMRNPPRLALCAVLAAWSCLLAPAWAQSPKTSPKFSGPPHEPPDREADALHLRLEVSFDWDRKEVTGKAQHAFRSLADGLRALSLDAVDIQVLKATAKDGAALSFETRPEKLRIDLGR